VKTRIKIFYPELQSLTGSQDAVSVEGETVGECIAALVSSFPGSKELLFDRRGNLLKQVFVYVNAESLAKTSFSQKLNPKDELILAVLTTGG